MDRKVDKRRGKVHRTTISQQPLFNCSRSSSADRAPCWNLLRLLCSNKRNKAGVETGDA